jgi:hypothetical protein
MYETHGEIDNERSGMSLHSGVGRPASDGDHLHRLAIPFAIATRP